MGGLLSSQKLYPFMDRGDVLDFNQATDAGTYKVRRRLQYFTVSNDLVVVVAKLNYKYGGVYIHGFNGGTGELFNFAVMMKGEGTNAYIVGELGSSSHPIKVYRDDDNNIYIEGETGADCQGWIEVSDRSDNNIEVQNVTLPSSAIRLLPQ